MDSQFKIGSVFFGIDPILGFIPFFGDIIVLLISLYIVSLVKEYPISTFDKTRIYINISIDFLIKLIPIIGSFLSAFFKANMSNMKIIEKYSKKMKFTGKVIEGQIVL